MRIKPPVVLARLAVSVAAAAVVTGACAAPGAIGSAAASPQIVTLSSSGQTIVLRPGSHAVLRLDHRRWRWSSPLLRGTGVRLEEIDYERDPGFDEWKLRARNAGRATIAVRGRSCASCAAGARIFRLTVVVRAS